MYSQKKPVEEIPLADTAIWACQNDGCKGWMRDNFAFETTPTCVICHSPMVSDTRMLPLLVNSNSNMKSLKPGTLI